MKVKHDEELVTLKNSKEEEIKELKSTTSVATSTMQEAHEKAMHDIQDQHEKEKEEKDTNHQQVMTQLKEEQSEELAVLEREREEEVVALKESLLSSSDGAAAALRQLKSEHATNIRSIEETLENVKEEKERKLAESETQRKIMEKSHRETLKKADQDHAHVLESLKTEHKLQHHAVIKDHEQKLTAAVSKAMVEEHARNQIKMEEEREAMEKKEREAEEKEKAMEREKEELIAAHGAKIESELGTLQSTHEEKHKAIALQLTSMKEEMHAAHSTRVQDMEKKHEETKSGLREAQIKTCQLAWQKFRAIQRAANRAQVSRTIMLSAMREKETQLRGGTEQILTELKEREKKAKVESERVVIELEESKTKSKELAENLAESRRHLVKKTWSKYRLRQASQWNTRACTQTCLSLLVEDRKKEIMLASEIERVTEEKNDLEKKLVEEVGKIQKTRTELETRMNEVLVEKDQEKEELTNQLTSQHEQVLESVQSKHEEHLSSAAERLDHLSKEKEVASKVALVVICLKNGLHRRREKKLLLEHSRILLRRVRERRKKEEEQRLKKRERAEEKLKSIENELKEEQERRRTERNEERRREVEREEKEQKEIVQRGIVLQSELADVRDRASNEAKTTIKYMESEFKRKQDNRTKMLARDACSRMRRRRRTLMFSTFNSWIQFHNELVQEEKEMQKRAASTINMSLVRMFHWRRTRRLSSDLLGKIREEKMAMEEMSDNLLLTASKAAEMEIEHQRELGEIRAEHVRKNEEEAEARRSAREKEEKLLERAREERDESERERKAKEKEDEEERIRVRRSEREEVEKTTAALTSSLTSSWEKEKRSREREASLSAIAMTITMARYRKKEKFFLRKQGKDMLTKLGGRIKAVVSAHEEDKEQLSSTRESKLRLEATLEEAHAAHATTMASMVSKHEDHLSLSIDAAVNVAVEESKLTLQKEMVATLEETVRGVESQLASQHEQVLESVQSKHEEHLSSAAERLDHLSKEKEVASKVALVVICLKNGLHRRREKKLLLEHSRILLRRVRERRKKEEEDRRLVKDKREQQETLLAGEREREQSLQYAHSSAELAKMVEEKEKSEKEFTQCKLQMEEQAKRTEAELQQRHETTTKELSVRVAAHETELEEHNSTKMELVHFQMLTLKKVWEKHKTRKEDAARARLGRSIIIGVLREKEETLRSVSKKIMETMKQREANMAEKHEVVLEEKRIILEEEEKKHAAIRMEVEELKTKVEEVTGAHESVQMNLEKARGEHELASVVAVEEKEMARKMLEEMRTSHEKSEEERKRTLANLEREQKQHDITQGEHAKTKDELEQMKKLHQEQGLEMKKEKMQHGETKKRLKEEEDERERTEGERKRIEMLLEKEIEEHELKRQDIMNSKEERAQLEEKHRVAVEEHEMLSQLREKEHQAAVLLLGESHASDWKEMLETAKLEKKERDETMKQNIAAAKIQLRIREWFHCRWSRAWRRSVFTTLKARNKIHETKMSVMMESEQASGARADVAEERFREEETRTLDNIRSLRESHNLTLNEERERMEGNHEKKMAEMARDMSLLVQENESARAALLKEKDALATILHEKERAHMYTVKEKEEAHTTISREKDALVKTLRESERDHTKTMQEKEDAHAALLIENETLANTLLETNRNHTKTVQEKEEAHAAVVDEQNKSWTDKYDAAMEKNNESRQLEREEWRSLRVRMEGETALAQSEREEVEAKLKISHEDTEAAALVHARAMEAGDVERERIRNGMQSEMEKRLEQLRLLHEEKIKEEEERLRVEMLAHEVSETECIVLKKELEAREQSMAASVLQSLVRNGMHYQRIRAQTKLWMGMWKEKEKDCQEAIHIVIREQATMRSELERTCETQASDRLAEQRARHEEQVKTLNRHYEKEQVRRWFFMYFHLFVAVALIIFL